LVRWGLFFFFSYWMNNSVTCLILFWIPLNIQFATIGLLIPFSLCIVYAETWEEHTRQRSIIVYVVLITFITIFCIVTSTFGIEEIERNNAIFIFWRDPFRSLYTTIIYLLFTVIFSYYGYFMRLRILENEELKSWCSHKKFTLILIFLLLTLTGGFVYHLVCIININILFKIDFANNFPVAGLLFLWEIIPSTLIYSLYWTVPQKILYSSTQTIVTVQNIRLTMSEPHPISEDKNSSTIFFKPKH